jgi:hypothetical protein
MVPFPNGDLKERLLKVLEIFNMEEVVNCLNKLHSDDYLEFHIFKSEDGENLKISNQKKLKHFMKVHEVIDYLNDFDPNMNVKFMYKNETNQLKNNGKIN